MDNDLLEFFGSAKAKCPQCNSTKLLFFVETRLKGCMSWACLNCQAFEVCGKSKQEIEDFMKAKEQKPFV